MKPDLEIQPWRHIAIFMFVSLLKFTMTVNGLTCDSVVGSISPGMKYKCHYRMSRWVLCARSWKIHNTSSFSCRISSAAYAEPVFPNVPGISLFQLQQNIFAYFFSWNAQRTEYWIHNVLYRNFKSFCGHVIFIL